MVTGWRRESLRVWVMGHDGSNKSSIRRGRVVVRILLHVLGVDDVSGRWYAWWSGAGSDLSILAAPGIWWRTHNCHVGRCWRLARHPVEGTTWQVCRRHHPDDHPTPHDVKAVDR